MKIWIILCASSLGLIVTGFYTMFAMPVEKVKGNNQEIQQVVSDVEFIHDVYGQYIRLRSAYPATDTILNPFGILFIAAGIALQLIALEHYNKRI